MAKIYPDINNISRLTVPPTDGELFLVNYLKDYLDDTFEVFFNPYLDGDRPDIIILKKDHGAMVIEVKDWSLDLYQVDQNNKWHCQNSIIRSPFQQAFRYKSNLFELHLPVLGLKELTNRNFFNVIQVAVYFHGPSQKKLSQLYDLPLTRLRDLKNQENDNMQKKPFSAYEKQMNFLASKTKQITRDKGLSWTKDNLDKKLSNLKKMQKNILFMDDVYEDFKRRLLPPSHTLKQGVAIPFDKKQLRLSQSESGFSKIKGVAGCGKTTILAQRAINAFKRHQKQVLILTYNITLRHFIRDAISRIQGGGVGNEYEIIHYHGFINNKLNEYSIDTSSYNGRIDNLYKDQLLFKKLDIKEFEKFNTILIDEVQDYEPEWVKIIRDNFLASDAEMVLFGDQSQNIYKREDSPRESVIVLGFGEWQRLTKSYRSALDSHLLELFKHFQQAFLVDKYKESELFDSTYKQGDLNYDLLAYESYGATYDADLIFEKIQEYVIEYKIHPNDLAIVCSEVEFLRPLNNKFISVEKTKVMFEEDGELELISNLSDKDKREAIDKIRRRKKMFFHQNSGLIKLSTIHSFKGLEAETVFCILIKGDDPEIVYTGITRAQKNLVVFDMADSKYEQFFVDELQAFI